LTDSSSYSTTPFFNFSNNSSFVAIFGASPFLFLILSSVVAW
jgi:hypothetical protein